MPRGGRAAWDEAGPLVPQAGVPTPYDDGQAECPVCARVLVASAFDLWCPRCGEDIFLSGVRCELAMALQMAASPRWALVRAVQAFELAMRSLYRRAAHMKWGAAEAHRRVRKHGMALGKLPRVEAIFRDELGTDIRDVIEATSVLRAKRNVIVHKGSVIDEIAMARAPQIGRLGGDIKVTPEEVAESIDTIQRVIEGLYARLIRT